jgi:non-homologous end joining protein Ku
MGEHERIVGKLNRWQFLCGHHYLERFNALSYRGNDDRKAGEFDPATFRDRYEEALLAHLRAKQAGTVPECKPALAAPQRVVNLMEALRRSVAADTKEAAPRKGGAAAAPARKRA